MESDSETAIILVLAGVGIAVMPDFDVPDLSNDLYLKHLPLDTRGYRVVICMYVHIDHPNPLIPLFLKECIKKA